MQMNAPNSHVITFGGSYPGNLAAWFRLKYPHLTLGSVASSAPVQARMDFHQYMEVVSDALVYFGGWPCRDALARAVKVTAAKLRAQEYLRLQQDFKLCGPIETPRDAWVFETNLMGNIQVGGRVCGGVCGHLNTS
jgi:thymus-specific serine protease